MSNKLITVVLINNPKEHQCIMRMSDTWKLMREHVTPANQIGPGNNAYCITSVSTTCHAVTPNSNSPDIPIFRMHKFHKAIGADIASSISLSQFISTKLYRTDKTCGSRQPITKSRVRMIGINVMRYIKLIHPVLNAF